MDASAPINVLSDTYNVWVPIEDNDLTKSIEVDANGDWIVTGVMSSDDKDEEDDSITPDGMDCSYFLTKGWIKYEHGNNPNQFIGEPMEVRVGRFDHPTLRKSVNGIYVKGRLFQNRELAKQAVRALEDLQKSHTKRTMGWSIEGNVKERDRTTGKIIKSVLRNVVLTMNPVNTMTWAELAKSFASNHELEIDTVDKSLDTGSMAEVMPQSVEGAKHDPQDEWIRLFREFVKSFGLNKSLRAEFMDSNAGASGVNAYIWASEAGVDYDTACEFASYVSDRYDTLKSLFGKIGGENMSTKAKENMAQLLDTDLDELQKSLDSEDLEVEELEKSFNEEDKGTSEEDEDADKEDDEDKDEDKEDEETEKSLKTDFAKSFGASSEENADALDVSGFLANLVDEVGFSMDGFNKSLSHVAKQQVATVQALGTIGTLVKSLMSELTEVRADNAELQKSLGEVLQRPVGRKSVVNQREVQTITKSLGAGEGGDNKPGLTRGRVLEVLNKSFDSGNMAIGKELMRFEGGTPVDKLNLPESIKQELGMV